MILLADKVILDLAGILVDHRQDKPRAGRRGPDEDSGEGCKEFDFYRSL
jgi:hypothetical protein